MLPSGAARRALQTHVPGGGGLTIAPKKHRQIIDFVLNVVFVWERLCWRKGPLF